MKSNLKHIEESFILEESLKDKNKLNDWIMKNNVSSKSKFLDNVWHLEAADIYSNGITIDWTKITNSGFSLGDYPHLLLETKKVIFFMKTTIATRKTRKSLYQLQIFNLFIYLINWMINNKIYKFSDFTKKDFYEYISWVKKTKCKEDYKLTLSRYLYPLFHLYNYRDYLEHGLKEDFFEGKGPHNFTQADKNHVQQTKAIPNDVVEKVCRKILPIIDYFYENNHSVESIDQQSLIIKKDNLIASTKNNKDSYVIDILNAMGYFIVGLYTGMRISELGSLKKDCLEIDDNNVVVLNSTLFKLVPTDKGRSEKWGCGINNEQNYAVKAIKVLSNLSPNNYDKVFFKYYNKKITHRPVQRFNEMLKELMIFCDIDWDITTHQLRRTFAKLIGMTDKTNLLALKEHFKHVSLAMTDYYVGTNPELILMINEDKQQEIADGLESILSSGNLAGKMGEKIAKSNLKFRGNVEARKEYINDVLNNSDLIVVPHEYGFCIYQPEQAKCKGENQNIGLNTCTKCNNFAVSSKHKTFWINRVEQYEIFKKQISELPNQESTMEELTFEIKSANAIINKINKD